MGGNGFCCESMKTLTGIQVLLGLALKGGTDGKVLKFYAYDLLWPHRVVWLSPDLCLSSDSVGTRCMRGIASVEVMATIHVRGNQTLDGDADLFVLVRTGMDKLKGR